MQKLSILRMAIGLGTVLLIGTLKVNSAIASFRLALVTSQSSELNYEGIPLKCYVQAANAIQDDFELQGNLERFSLLSGVITQYVNAGQLDTAIQIATNLEAEDSGDELLTMLVAEQLLTLQKGNAPEKLSTAFKAAQAIRGKTSRVETLLKIAEASVQLGQSNQALQAIALAQQDAQMLEDAYPLVRVAANYIAAGQPNQALPVLSRSEQKVRVIVKADERIVALAWVAGRYAAAGQPDKARSIVAPVLKLLNSPGYSNRRNTLLARVTANYASFGEKETLAGAMELLRAIADQGQRDWALTRMSEAYRSAGHYDLALETANLLQNADRKAEALTEISQGYWTRGQQDKASQTLERMFQLVSMMSDSDRQYATLLRLALNYTAFKQTEKATEALDRAQQVVSQFQELSKQLSALNTIASMYASIEQKDKAATVLDRELTLANDIKDAQTKKDLLMQIVQSYALIDQVDRAINVANTIQDAKTRAIALKIVAQRYVPQQPEKAFEMVQSIASLDPDIAHQTLISIASELARAKQYGQALQAINRIEDNDLANWARIVIATEYAQAGHLDRALQLADSIKTMASVSTSESFSNTQANQIQPVLKNQTLLALALLYAQAERFPQALQAAQGIESGNFKDQALVAIAKQQAKVGQYSSAIQLTNTLTDVRQRELLLQLLTCARQ